MRSVTILFLLFVCSTGFGQILSGMIKDAKTKKPIAFVNLKISKSRQGTSTDIDGKFSLRIPTNYHGDIIISHVSYEQLKVTLSELKLSNNEVLLQTATTNLNELVFVADENPAHDIIRKTVANRKLHDPNRLSSYQYRSYSKQTWKLEGKSPLADSLIEMVNLYDTLQLSKKDSSVLETDALAKSQHLFITESVTEKKYLSPGIVNERLIAIKTSGFKSPLFATTGTDFQPLGFYDEVITIFDKPHTNPIAEGTLRRYNFYIEDTTYYQQDTVFILSFEPKQGKKFESLEGYLSISKNGYALRNVIATTADAKTKNTIKVQQSYDCLGGVWFPTQLNTDIIFYDLDFFGRNMLIETKSYFSEIQLNTELSKKEFSDVALNLSEIDEAISAQVLMSNRHKTLDSLDVKTYDVWDTLTNKLTSMTNIFEFIITERIPIGLVDLRIDKFVQLNQYEKVRIGAGGFTNNKFSESIELGAYGGYGLKDDAWKYGGSLKLNFSPRTATYLQLTYAKDLHELGRKNYFDGAKVLNKQLLRSIEGNNYNFNESYKITLHRRIASFTYSQISLEKINSIPVYSYNYDGGDGSLINTFDFTEFSLSTRYVKQEKYLNLKGRKILSGHGYPILTFKYTKGFSNWLSGDFDYQSIDFTFDYEKKSRFGNTKIYLIGGLTGGDTPISKLYAGRGISSSSFVVPHYFQTMKLYEFFSDKELSLFLNHNFGNILINTKIIKPELILYQNAGIGELSNPQRHENITIHTLEKGYLEAGVGFKNLIRVNYADLGYAGFGADVFYRYGANAFTKTSDNFAVRLNFHLTF